MIDTKSWVPVTVARATVIDANEGFATVRWTLIGGTTEDWIARFRGYGTRKGSGEYVLTSSEPAIALDLSITWNVPYVDIEDAESYVKQSVEATNLAYFLFLRTNEKWRAIQADEVDDFADDLLELRDPPTQIE